MPRPGTGTPEDVRLPHPSVGSGSPLLVGRGPPAASARGPGETQSDSRSLQGVGQARPQVRQVPGRKHVLSAPQHCEPWSSLHSSPHPNLGCQAAPQEACRFRTPCTCGQQPPPTLAGAKLLGARSAWASPSSPKPSGGLTLDRSQGHRSASLRKPCPRREWSSAAGQRLCNGGSEVRGRRGWAHAHRITGSLGGAVTPTCSHLAPPKRGAEGGSGFGSAAEAGKKQGEVLQPGVGGTAAPRLPVPAGRLQGSRPKQALGRNLEPLRPESGHTTGRWRGGPLGTPGVNRELSLRPVTPNTSLQPREDTGCPPGGRVTLGTWAALR